jgi:hypothetical protein
MDERFQKIQQQKEMEKENNIEDEDQKSIMDLNKTI